MRYLSVCSGIEAATVAWHPLGWTPVAFSEIEPFPSAVLAHHYPTVPNWGDMTRFKDWPDADIDLLVGGTPCQSFSVAGLRKGLDDPRGNLALVFPAVAARYRPTWVVWENVPGVLSSGGGADFASFLGGLSGQRIEAPEGGWQNSGVIVGIPDAYSLAWRVLDAQYFGLAQRRARVFVVGHLGDWRRAAAVLFERESLSGHPAPRREAGQGVTTGPTLGATGGRNRGLGNGNETDHLIPSTGDISHCLNAGGMGRIDYESETLSAHALSADGFDASEDGTGRGTPLIPIDMRQASRGATMTNNRRDGACGGGAPGTGIGEDGDPAPTIASSHVPAIAFDTTQMTSKANRSHPKVGDPCHPLAAGAHPPAVAFDWQSGGDMRGLDPRPLAQLQSKQIPATLSGMQVRRLTPRECERLQGFPDDYTLIPLSRRQRAEVDAELRAYFTRTGQTFTEDELKRLAKDGPRYKALGNSMAALVMRWIGRRIQMVDDIKASAA